MGAAALLVLGLGIWALLPSQDPGGDVRAPAPLSSQGSTRDITPLPRADAGIRTELIAEAEHAIAQRLGPERIAVFEGSTVYDVRQRIVCGRVRMRGPAPSSTRRYLSFGGTGITMVDDGGPDFAEMYLSACSSAGQH